MNAAQNEGEVRAPQWFAMATASHSVSEWIASLKFGDLDAVQKIWTRYKDELVAAARYRLSHSRPTRDDEDDISQSVLIAIWRGAEAGRFDDIRNRDELWWTLLKLTKCSVIDSIRLHSAQKRGGRDGRIGVMLEADLKLADTCTFETLVSVKATHETVAALEEQTRIILSNLQNPELQQIAQDRIEGYTSEEIAKRMDMSLRSVERKLRLIRERWSNEFERAYKSGSD